MSKYWLDYVKSCYDLIVETEGSTRIILDHDVEAYVVHVMANNFERTDIGVNPIALQILQAAQNNSTQDLLRAADECLLIHSYPLRRTRWPSDNYYRDMGITAYGLANHVMERHFEPAGVVLTALFRRMHMTSN
jgi:hypothetical protein